MSIGYDWRCETCGCTGSADMRSHEGAYEEGQILLALHRSVSPDCKGGAGTIRVTERESTLTQRRVSRRKIKP